MIFPLAFALAAADSSCRLTLDSLAAKVERNYPGVTLELTSPSKRRQYDGTLFGAQQAANGAVGDGCLAALRRVTDFWKDEHLFVFQTARLDAVETARRMERAERRQLQEDTLRARWSRFEPARDPIEGVWFDRGLRVAVLPDPSQSAGAFVAIVLRADTATWQPGMIRARLQRVPGGGYAVEMHERSHQVRYLDATIHKGLLLRMPPHLWGRELPLQPTDSALVDAADPRAPTLTWRDSTTVVVSIPSHEYGYQGALRRLLVDHRARLARADRMVVDLRGNIGGSSAMTDPLRPYLAARPGTERPARVAAWRPWMLSTPENEAAVRNSVPAGRDTSAQVRGLLQRLRENPGGKVRFLEDGELSPERPPASVEDQPRAIALLVDGGVVSAGEAFVLESARSPRVTIYGERTAGVLDYGNVSIVRLRPGESRWFLGYPTVIANDRVPAEGIRTRGILPDVKITLAGQSDAIGAVLQRMP